ncbi:helix-turn-helix domain-containing protein [uncultured Novosphingobium sp.]|uniref:helix-turn-helix domain-containing protein n=1 Tax=uncultured Novosphingobium sp. TaxID=292277 RepID=UPI003748B8EC
MTALITQCEILRNRQVSSGSMDADYAVRNNAGMKRDGLIKARKRLKLTQEKMAERLGVSAPQVSRWENGHDGIPSQRIPSLVESYEASVAELLDAGEVEANGVVQKFEGASYDRMRQDLPILGTAMGADRVSDDLAIEQTYLYTDDVIGYAKRPVLLDGRGDAYGVYVQGSSMVPAHADGVLILVESKRPPMIGDDVVVYLRRTGEDQDGDDGESARTVLIKRLVRRSGSFIELEQFTPPLTFTVATKDVLKMHRVLTLTDLLA